MLDVNFTNVRDLQRNSKQLADTVNKTDKPIIVMCRNKPLFAIVSLKAVEDLQKKQNSLQGLFNLARWAKEKKINLPADLAKNHDTYTWD